MPDGLKYGLWALGALLLAALGVVLASNLALLFYGAHDGQIDTLTVWPMLTGANERAATAARLASMVVGGAVVLAVLGIWNARNRQSLFGEARWATENEVRKAGLRSRGGLILGKFGGRYLNFGGQEHVFVSAPTRGGKGVGIVIPNLLNWPGSTIVLDVKKENWKITAGFRQSAGQSVHLFDPLDAEGRTARYNPLGYVNRSNTTELYDDLQRIANMLFPSDARSGDPFWTDSARTAFIGIAGYIAETDDLPFTIGEVLRQTSASPRLADHFFAITAARRDTPRALSQQCCTALTDFLSNSDKALQSIRSTVTSKLNLWLNPRVDYATSANDFDLRELRRQPISIYLGVTPDNLNRLAPLLNLFFQQAVDLNSRLVAEQDATFKHQVMLMLDEFRALGNVEVISKGVAFLAGYGFRIVTIVQSPAQLRAVYGPDDAANFITNHGVEVIYTPKDLAVAKELSERFGFDTVSRTSRSRNLGFSKRNRSESTSDQQRALMLPQELTLTPYEDAYILKGQMRPLKAKKILYFKDPVFKKRLLPPPVVQPSLTPDRAEIESLQSKVRSYEKRIEELIVRDLTDEEVTKPEQPADGTDKKKWITNAPLEKQLNSVDVQGMPSGVAADAVGQGLELWMGEIGMPPGKFPLNKSRAAAIGNMIERETAIADAEAQAEAADAAGIENTIEAEAIVVEPVKPKPTPKAKKPAAPRKATEAKAVAATASDPKPKAPRKSRAKPKASGTDEDQAVAGE